MLASGLLNATGLKKNYSLGSGNRDHAFDASITEAYEYMAIGTCSGAGREILVACGLAEWFSRFSVMSHVDKTSWKGIPARSGTQELADEIIILFANMLQEVTDNGI